MSDVIIPTKIVLPRRRKELVSRQRLIKLCYDLLDDKLILVIAPAGYGKTSLLVDFTTQLDLPACWYSLDELDRRPQRFYAHFIAAIRQAFPKFGELSRMALESLDPFHPDIPQLVSVIVNDAYQHVQDHFLLVLDDYHLVSDVPEIEAFVNRFALESAENCHLVLASRTLVSLPDLPLLVARSQVGGIGYEELAFRPEEIQSLVLQNFHVSLPETTAQDLARETEGWITGLLLSAQAEHTGMTRQIRAARIAGVELYSYLARQVLNQQLPEVRTFLFRTAFLDEFDASLCQAIWGDEINWGVLAESVIQQNLFVLPVGENGRHLRYHHLFREFLQAQFVKEHPQEVPHLLGQIARAYAQLEDWERAFAIYKRLGDTQAMADLIEKAGPYLVKTVRYATLANWLDTLPADLLASRPRLVSHRGSVYILQGKVGDGLIYLNQAQVMQTASGDHFGLARTLARRATAYRYLGNYQAAITDGNEALSLAEGNEELVPVQAEAHHAIGMSLYHLGKLEEAIQHFKVSLDLYVNLRDQPSASMANMELGICYHLQGKTHQALRCYQQSLAFWQSVYNTAQQSFLLNNMGELHFLSGDYIEAIRLFDTGITLARKSGITRSEAYLFYNLMNLYTDLEAYDSAKEALRQAQHLCKTLDDHLLELLIILAEAGIARREGNLFLARQHLQRAYAFVERSHSDYESGLWNVEMGRLQLAEGQPEPATHALTAAVRSFRAGGQTIEAANALLLLAQAYSLCGDTQSVRASLEQSFQLISTLEHIQPVIVTGGELTDLLQAWSQDPQLGATISHFLHRVRHFREQIIPLRRSLRQNTTVVLLVPPQLNIHAFGRSSVKINGQTVTHPNWSNQKRARELLFYLLCHPEGRTKEEIGLDLWPDSPPEKLKIQFRNTVYLLRCALGQDTILFNENRYYFNHDMDYVYDVQDFESRLRQAKVVHASQERLELLKIAVEAYQGPFFIEGEGLWVLSERQRLSDLYVEALLEIAQTCLTSKDYDGALRYSRLALQEDRYLEEAHRIAMKVFAARGDRAGVIQQYEECNAALAEDLHAEPSPETKQLLEILRQ